MAMQRKNVERHSARLLAQKCPKQRAKWRSTHFLSAFPDMPRRNYFQSPRSVATFSCKASGVTVAGGHAGSITSAILENTPRG